MRAPFIIIIKNKEYVHTSLFLSACATKEQRTGKHQKKENKERKKRENFCLMINYYTFRLSNKSVEIEGNSYLQCLQVILSVKMAKIYNFHMLSKALTWIMKFWLKKFRGMSFGFYHCLAATNVRNQDQQTSTTKKTHEEYGSLLFSPFQKKWTKKKYNMKKTTSIHLKQMAIWQWPEVYTKML